MEQEEEIGPKADEGHHDAVPGEDPVQVECTPRGKALIVVEVTLGLEVGNDCNETQVDDQQRGCQVQLQPPESVDGRDNNGDSLATIPAETTPVGDGGELRNDSKPNLKHRDLRPVVGKGKLHGDKEEVVEKEEEEGAHPHREEEEGGVVGDHVPQISVLQNLIVDHYTSNPEEGCDCKQGDILEG